MDASEQSLNSGDPIDQGADPADTGEVAKPAKKPDPWVRRNFPPPPPLAAGLFTQRPWVGFLAPFIVYMVVGMFEPSPPEIKKPAKPAAKETTQDKSTEESQGETQQREPGADDELLEPAPETESDSDGAAPAADDADTAAKPTDGHGAAADPHKADEDEAEGGWFDWMNLPRLLGISYGHYPLVYTIKIALTIGAMVFVLPVYRTFFPVRVGGLAIGVGVMGIGIWIGLWEFQAGASLLEGLGLGDMGARSAFNPWKQIENPLWRYGFLCVRFLGLVAIVPIIEEYFLRGFLIRYLVRENFWDVPFGYADDYTFAMATIVPMLMHPAELLPAAVWFSLVTWLMVRTRNIWDCVAAHAVTNLLLGLYVVFTGRWELM